MLLNCACFSLCDSLIFRVCTKMVRVFAMQQAAYLPFIQMHKLSGVFQTTFKWSSIHHIHQANGIQKIARRCRIRIFVDKCNTVAFQNLMLYYSCQFLETKRNVCVERVRIFTALKNIAIKSSYRIFTFIARLNHFVCPI